MSIPALPGLGGGGRWVLWSFSVLRQFRYLLKARSQSPVSLCSSCLKIGSFRKNFFFAPQTTVILQWQSPGCSCSCSTKCASEKMHLSGVRQKKPLHWTGKYFWRKMPLWVLYGSWEGRSGRNFTVLIKYFFPVWIFTKSIHYVSRKNNGSVLQKKLGEHSSGTCNGMVTE